MRILSLPITLALAAVLGGLPAAAATVAWGQGCMPFIGQAEAYYALPAGLLEAVALTESGQHGAPYPWALNIGGQAIAAGTYREAAGLLRRADGRPRRDVAIGCMQIHMQYHLDSFVEPEWALDPRHNVWYGARFLDQLRRQYGDWISAIAHYHGSDLAAQRSYLCQVARHLQRTGPATRANLGLSACGTAPVAARHRFVPGAGPDRAGRARLAVMAARRIGRIIVLGEDRR